MFGFFFLTGTYVLKYSIVIVARLGGVEHRYI